MTNKRSEYLKNFWSNASYEEREKRLKPMLKGRKKSDSQGKAKDRVLKGKEYQRNRIIQERLDSLKDYSFVLPNNDLRKLNIFLNSEDDKVVSAAIRYKIHYFDSLVDIIDDSNSGYSHMHFFNRFWGDKNIKESKLYYELLYWKNNIIKSFKNRSYTGYGNPLYHSKKYMNLPDIDIINACEEYRIYLYDKMADDIINIEDGKIRHKRLSLAFNKYYHNSNNLEEIRKSKLFNILTDYKNEILTSLIDKSYINIIDRKHIIDYLVSLTNSKDGEISNEAKKCLKYYLDNYILTSIDETNTRMSSFVVFNTYYQKEYIDDTRLKKYLNSFKEKILKSFEENDPSIISKRNKISELLDKLSNINDEDISNIAKKIKEENYNKIESLKEDNNLKEDFISIFNGYYISNIISRERYLRDDKGYITHINDIPIQQWYDNIQHNNIKFNEPDFFIVLTGRTQDSAKRNSLLDDYFVKENITWFVYIKFDELGNPLVVGKTGSKLVNASGCDVVFDKNPDGGPARQYLIDNNLDWDKTQIAVHKCDTEQEALSKEIEIGIKYSLFFS